ncbi:MAG: GNAT family N-acetyltransferase [Erysipelotrichaceae bacterium]|nr:GNAT family N-acetyltransferase [Erysipelotrichaceae bacterium]
MVNIKEQALAYLSKDYLGNIDMIEPIRTDQVELIYVDDQTVFLKEKRSGVYMINAEDLTQANKVVLLAEDIQSIRTNLKQQLDFLQEKFNLNELFLCKQCVYQNKKPLPLETKLDIKALDLSYFDIISANYDLITKEDLKTHLKNQDLFGGFIDDQLVGFIGTHLEGSIGLLYVFNKYRKRGYASDLEAFMINHQLANNLVPFAQVKLNNFGSFAVQRKLKMTIVDKTICWAYNT